MPNTVNVDVLLNTIDIGEAESLLILVDKKIGLSGYCLFRSAPYNSVQLDSVHQYFDQTLQTLQHPSTVYFAPQELPILSAVGQYVVTVIERDEEGGITVIDGNAEPVESHMGVGG